MENLIKKILQETSEVKERGIKISRLSKLQPKNYLVQNLKSKEKQKKKLEIFKEDESIFLSAIEDIKNLSWKDLIFKEKTDSNYYVYFPKTIDKKLKDSLKNVKKYDSRINNQLDKRYASFLEYYDNVTGMYEINIYMEEFRNRTHFPEGVPNWALGLGLGIKIYRKLLNIAKFIQSSESASADVQKLYTSLIQMNDVNVVLTKFRSLVIDGNVEKNEKAKIIGEFVLELYEDKVFKRKITLNKDIVFDSTLMSELGKEKLTKLLEEIKKLSKQEPTRLAFRKGKPEDDDSEDEECDPCPVCDGVGQWVDNRGRTQICGDCEGSGCREN